MNPSHDGMSTMNPSHDDFNHNVRLVAALDRFTSSSTVLPINGPTLQEAKDGCQKFQLSNGHKYRGYRKAIIRASSLWEKDRLAKGANGKEMTSERNRAFRNSHLLPYIDDDELVECLIEGNRLSWLASRDREDVCHRNARKDILASGQGEHLRVYLESMHRNIIILEKRLSEAESYINTLKHTPMAEPVRN